MLRTMADEGDPAAMLGGDIEDLLDAMNVTGKAGNDHPSARIGDDLAQHRLDVALRCDEARHLRVRGVAKEKVDALLTETRESAQVGEPSVQRELVHLEVAGVQQQSSAGANGTASASGME